MYEEEQDLLEEWSKHFNFQMAAVPLWKCTYLHYIFK